MSNSEKITEDVWQSRILTAIGKVRMQKQRPNMERVAAVLRQVSLSTHTEIGTTIRLEPQLRSL